MEFQSPNNFDVKQPLQPILAFASNDSMCTPRMSVPIPKICTYKRNTEIISFVQTNYKKKKILKCKQIADMKLPIDTGCLIFIWAKSLNKTNSDRNVWVTGAHCFPFKIHSNVSIQWFPPDFFFRLSMNWIHPGCGVWYLCVENMWADFNCISINNDFNYEHYLVIECICIEIDEGIQIKKFEWIVDHDVLNIFNEYLSNSVDQHRSWSLFICAKLLSHSYTFFYHLFKFM